MAISEEVCNQYLFQQGTVYSYVIMGLIILMAGLLLLMLISGRWFLFGIRSKWQRMKGWGVVEIFNQDGSRVWRYADFKKPIAQIKGENVAYIFDHTKTTRILGINFASFDRLNINQKDLSANIEEVELKEKELSDKKNFFTMVREGLKKVTGKFAKKIFKVEWKNLYLIQEKTVNTNTQSTVTIKDENGDNKNILFSANTYDAMLTEAKLIAKQEAQQTRDWLVWLVIVVIVLLLVALYMLYSGNANIEGLVNLISSRGNVVVV